MFTEQSRGQMGPVTPEPGDVDDHGLVVGFLTSHLLPAAAAQPAVSRFRFKVFADYEAYVACQGQVDQLYRVRFLGPTAGGGSPDTVFCCLGAPREVTVQLVAQSRVAGASAS